MKKILICLGTRPEAIKLAPIILELRDRSYSPMICVTAQHRQMLDQVLDLFKIIPDDDLDIMTFGQSLEQLTSKIITSLEPILQKKRPDWVMVQGDTTTTFACALSSFYQKIPIAHIEAGLRTYDRYSPFPEEMNRKMTSCLSDLHFVPTKRAFDALIGEGYSQLSIHLVGNTVIDALFSILPFAKKHIPDCIKDDPFQDFILVTGHRRESFGIGFQNICKAIYALAKSHPKMKVIYPLHLNPKIIHQVHELLGNVSNIRLIEPLDYLSFVSLMDRCKFIMTDSGGISEEAPSLCKPLLIMRDTTERLEVIEEGVAKLVGTDEDVIFQTANRLLCDDDFYQSMSKGSKAYGSGDSAKRIVDILTRSH